MAIRPAQLLDKLSERLEQSAPIARLREVFERLSPRDRTLLMFLIVVFGVMGVGGAALGVRSVLTRLEADIRGRQDQLTRAVEIQSEHQQLKEKVEASEAALKEETDFMVQSFLERSATGAGITTEQLQAVEVRSEAPGDFYTETLVDMKFKKMGLQSLVDFLKTVEYGARPVKVKSLRVRPDRRNRDELDVEIELTVLTLKEGA